MVMTQAAETLGYALSGNYIYTVEAFTEYLNHLESDGKLALVLHGKSDLQKAIAKAVKALGQTCFSIKKIKKGFTGCSCRIHCLVYLLFMLNYLKFIKSTLFSKT